MLRSLILLVFCTGWVVSSSQNVRINYSSLGSCIVENTGTEGIRCEKGDYVQCMPNNLWCRDDIVDSCNVLGGLGQIWTNDTELCGNSSFWRNKTCDIFRYWERVAVGLRCAGGQQHCINPWYLRLTPDIEFDEFNSYYYEVRKRLII